MFVWLPILPFSSNRCRRFARTVEFETISAAHPRAQMRASLALEEGYTRVLVHHLGVLQDGD
jgi:hypothetical protein